MESTETLALEAVDNEVVGFTPNDSMESTETRQSLLDHLALEGFTPNDSMESTETQARVDLDDDATRFTPNDSMESTETPSAPRWICRMHGVSPPTTRWRVLKHHQDAQHRGRA